jgi:restriction system protein
MNDYYRVKLGRNEEFAQECHDGSFIGTDFTINQDLSGDLPDRWQDFNRQFIPVWLDGHPGKSKIAAGLSCAALHVISKGIPEGAIVLCPNDQGSYWVCEVVGSYYYCPDGILPHRRPVRWLSPVIQREDMSHSLVRTAQSPGTWRNLSKHREEIERLLEIQMPPSLIATDKDVEDPTVFALEKHLEEFLITNWQSTVLGKTYDIFEEEGELVGRQFTTDTGPIDILAISKDKKELLVVELKKGRASDTVVGQIQRYMGYMEEWADSDQIVKGVIIALDDDVRIRRALRVTRNIDFYRYEVTFKLTKEII